MPPSPLSTADVPSAFWEDASLVGSIPFKACALDPRFSYCTYIPPTAYLKAHEQKHQIPLLITIHGNGRNAGINRDALKQLADRVGAAILAPLFPTGIEDPNDMHGYKRMSHNGVRYDLVLLNMIEEVKIRWPRIETEKFFLVGFSGGGQFSLKFLYLYPEKLEAVSVGAPGMTTRLDEGLAWPEGIKGTEGLFGGRKVDIELLKLVREIQLIVGGDDVQKPGGGFLEWAAKRYGVKLPKLPPRRDALSDLQEEFKELGIKSHLVVVDGAAHESMKVLPDVIKFIEPCLKNWSVSHQS